MHLNVNDIRDSARQIELPFICGAGVGSFGANVVGEAVQILRRHHPAEDVHATYDRHRGHRQRQQHDEAPAAPPRPEAALVLGPQDVVEHGDANHAGTAIHSTSRPSVLQVWALTLVAQNTNQRGGAGEGEGAGQVCREQGARQTNPRFSTPHLTAL